MKYFALFAALVTAFVMAPVEAKAQQIKVDIKDVNVETMPTPQFAYQGESKRLPSAREWIEVEVEFEVESANRDQKYVDDVEFTYYVVMNDDKNTMLVERVTHINVPVKSEIFSNVFVSPSTIVNLTGSEASSASVVQAVAVEVRFQGALVGGEATDKASTKWWQTMARTEGLLLPKNETPFAILWTDRYAEIKKER